MRRRGWKKEEQGFGIDVIVSVRHPSHSSFLSPSSVPPPVSRHESPAWRAAPTENYPLTTGWPAIQATFSSLLCFSSRVLPHIDYNITTYPSFRVCRPPLLLPTARLSPFFFRRATAMRVSSDIYVHF